jgi:transcriptional regulator with XRE-family HTH domain
MTKYSKKEPIQTELSMFLRKRMADLNMNQVKLARLTGLSACGINLILNKGSVPQAKTMLKLASALEVQVEHLYRLAGMIPAEAAMNNQGNDLQELELLYLKLTPERQQIAIGLVKSLAEVNSHERYPVDTLLKQETFSTL